MRSYANSSSTTAYAESSTGQSFIRPGGGRDRSSSAKYSDTSTKSREKDEKERDKEREKGVLVRRPDDLVKVVRDRMFSWSYMMTWYQG